MTLSTGCYALLQTVSQSLAGRTAVESLLPLNRAEVTRLSAPHPGRTGESPLKPALHERASGFMERRL